MNEATNEPDCFAPAGRYRVIGVMVTKKWIVGDYADRRDAMAMMKDGHDSVRVAMRVYNDQGKWIASQGPEHLSILSRRS